jgi:hypothetical protein
MTRKVLLMDVDHTVSDAEWRDHMIGDWDNYYEEQKNDNPISETVAVVRALRQAGWEIVGCTARPEKYRKATVDWLVENCVPFDDLLMRRDGDKRRSPEVKVDLVTEYFGGDFSCVIMCLDDRLDVVEAMRAIGIPSFQVFAKSGGGGSGGEWVS